jgi:hypothetical protein
VKYILFAFGLYVLYQFIFRLVLPVYLAGRKIRKGFREMQERMQSQQQQNPNNPQQQSTAESKPRAMVGDYIDFEEVK